MKRREFITLLGGAAAAWPYGVWAQQGERVRRIGVLMGYAENDAEGLSRIKALEHGLKEYGWTDGDTIRITRRWATADAERIRTYSAELVGMKPDVIVANTATVMAGLKQATRTVPLVFVLLNDPVGGGFVSNLAHPGENITGFSAYENQISAKWLELLLQIAPGVSRVLIIQHAENPNRKTYIPEIETAARSFHIRVINPDQGHSSGSLLQSRHDRCGISDNDIRLHPNQFG